MINYIATQQLIIKKDRMKLLGNLKYKPTPPPDIWSKKKKNNSPVINKNKAVLSATTIGMFPPKHSNLAGVHMPLPFYWL